MSVLGCAYSASVVCSKYAADATADPDEAARKRLKKHGYYVRPIPKDCKAKRLGGWRPTYRIVSILNSEASFAMRLRVRANIIKDQM